MASNPGTEVGADISLYKDEVSDHPFLKGKNEFSFNMMGYCYRIIKPDGTGPAFNGFGIPKKISEGIKPPEGSGHKEHTYVESQDAFKNRINAQIKFIVEELKKQAPNGFDAGFFQECPNVIDANGFDRKEYFLKVLHKELDQLGYAVATEPKNDMFQPQGSGRFGQFAIYNKRFQAENITKKIEIKLGAEWNKWFQEGQIQIIELTERGPDGRVISVKQYANLHLRTENASDPRTAEFIAKLLSLGINVVGDTNARNLRDSIPDEKHKKENKTIAENILPNQSLIYSGNVIFQDGKMNIRENVTSGEDKGTCDVIYKTNKPVQISAHLDAVKSPELESKPDEKLNADKNLGLPKAEENASPLPPPAVVAPSAGEPKPAGVPLSDDEAKRKDELIKVQTNLSILHDKFFALAEADLDKYLKDKEMLLNRKEILLAIELNLTGLQSFLARNEPPTEEMLINSKGFLTYNTKIYQDFIQKQKLKKESVPKEPKPEVKTGAEGNVVPETPTPRAGDSKRLGDEPSAPASSEPEAATTISLEATPVVSPTPTPAPAPAPAPASSPAAPGPAASGSPPASPPPVIPDAPPLEPTPAPAAAVSPPSEPAPAPASPGPTPPASLAGAGASPASAPPSPLPPPPIEPPEPDFTKRKARDWDAYLKLREKFEALNTILETSMQFNEFNTDHHKTAFAQFKESAQMFYDNFEKQFKKDEDEKEYNEAIQSYFKIAEETLQSGVDLFNANKPKNLDPIEGNILEHPIVTKEGNPEISVDELNTLNDEKNKVIEKILVRQEALQKLKFSPVVYTREELEAIFKNKIFDNFEQDENGNYKPLIPGSIAYNNFPNYRKEIEKMDKWLDISDPDGNLKDQLEGLKDSEVGFGLIDSPRRKARKEVTEKLNLVGMKTDQLNREYSALVDGFENIFADKHLKPEEEEKEKINADLDELSESLDEILELELKMKQIKRNRWLLNPEYVNDEKAKDEKVTIEQVGYTKKDIEKIDDLKRQIDEKSSKLQPKINELARTQILQLAKLGRYEGPYLSLKGAYLSPSESKTLESHEKDFNKSKENLDNYDPNDDPNGFKLMRLKEDLILKRSRFINSIAQNLPSVLKSSELVDKSSPIHWTEKFKNIKAGHENYKTQYSQDATVADYSAFLQSQHQTSNTLHDLSGRTFPYQGKTMSSKEYEKASKTSIEDFDTLVNKQKEKGNLFYKDIVITKPSDTNAQTFKVEIPVLKGEVSDPEIKSQVIERRFNPKAKCASIKVSHPPSDRTLAIMMAANKGMSPLKMKKNCGDEATLIRIFQASLLANVVVKFSTQKDETPSAGNQEQRSDHDIVFKSDFYNEIKSLGDGDPNKGYEVFRKKIEEYNEKQQVAGKPPYQFGAPLPWNKPEEENKQKIEFEGGSGPNL